MTRIAREQVGTHQDDATDQELAEQLAGQIARFFDRPIGEATSRLQREIDSPGQEVARAWCRANPKTAEEVERFYKETDAYVFDLAADHCRHRRRAVWAVVAERIQRKSKKQQILFYGDGIGTDSLWGANAGHEVTYFDLEGVTSSFARFRFEEEGLADKVELVYTTAAIPEGNYDVVVSIEVLEHVPDPLAVMRDYFRALRYGGIALITESFASIGEDYPSHLPENQRYAGKTHHVMEQEGFASTYYNTNPVNYPMEFKKVGSGLPDRMAKVQGRLRRGVESRLRRYLVERKSS